MNPTSKCKHGPENYPCEECAHSCKGIADLAKNCKVCTGTAAIILENPSIYDQMDKWEQVGKVDVDSGLIWLGDPCYVFALPHSTKKSKFKSLNEVKKLPKDIGKSWIDFCNKVSDSNATQFNHDTGSPGAGVAIHNAYGDGSYPVFVKKTRQGGIKSVMIVFEDEFDEFNEEEDTNE